MTVSEAAARGDVEQVRRLLASGGNPNEPETEGERTPLIAAAYYGHVEVAERLRFFLVTAPPGKGSGQPYSTL